MMLEILHFPDPRLRNKAKPVEAFDKDLQTLADTMLETMYQGNGIGLAAPQVNISRRVIVIDISEERNQPLILINPNITESQGTQDSEEGCLSIPGYSEKIKRAQSVNVEAYDLNGKLFNLTAENLFSACIQHEIDHLDGKLFIDYLSQLKQQRIRKKLAKIRHSKERF